MWNVSESQLAKGRLTGFHGPECNSHPIRIVQGTHTYNIHTSAAKSSFAQNGDLLQKISVSLLHALVCGETTIYRSPQHDPQYGGRGLKLASQNSARTRRPCIAIKHRSKHLHSQCNRIFGDNIDHFNRRRGAMESPLAAHAINHFFAFDVQRKLQNAVRSLLYSTRYIRRFSAHICGPNLRWDGGGRMEFVQYFQITVRGSLCFLLGFLK